MISVMWSRPKSQMSTTCSPLGIENLNVLSLGHESRLPYRKGYQGSSRHFVPAILCYLGPASAGEPSPHLRQPDHRLRGQRPLGRELNGLLQVLQARIPHQHAAHPTVAKGEPQRSLHEVFYIPLLLQEPEAVRPGLVLAVVAA